MSDRLRESIEDGRVHVLDGAMGTVLYARGVFVNVCYDQLNLTEPDVVLSVHSDYVRAGAELLETNSFGANPVKLSAFGLEAETEAVNRAAARLAIRAAGDRACVLGAIGPLGVRIEPWGPTSREEAMDLFARQVIGLLEGGVHGFILETFGDVRELEAAYLAVRRESDLPVVAQMSLTDEGSTTYGTGVEAITGEIISWGVDVVGLNCSVGPSAMLEAIERMAQVTDLPLSAQPNAGLPRDVGDRKIYLASPEYMARYARRLIAAGARFVGGCCGTTPEHTRAIAEYVGQERPRPTTVYVSGDELAAAGGGHPVALEERSRWGRKLARREFVTSVELAPPRGWEPAELLEGCRALHAADVDAVNLLDGPRALSRMGSIASAIIIQREVELEAVVHYTCRDRNMLGMMGDLLGAAAAGIRNLLLVTGDPPPEGPYDNAGVFDIDSIGLTNLAYRLNHGLDPGGGSIGEPTPFVIGVAVNPWAIDPEAELRRLHWKVDAGAEYAITQPVFDSESFHGFLERIERFQIPIIAGIWPLPSLRNAEFLANEVPGVAVPEAVLDRMRGAEARGEGAAVEEGLAIAREVLSAVRDGVAGVVVGAPGGDADLALEVLAP